MAITLEVGYNIREAGGHDRPVRPSRMGMLGRLYVVRLLSFLFDFEVNGANSFTPRVL